MKQNVIQMINECICHCVNPNIIKICMDLNCHNHSLFCLGCERNHQNHKMNTFPLNKIQELVDHNPTGKAVNNLITKLEQFQKTFNDRIEQLVQQLKRNNQIIDSNYSNSLEIMQAFQDFKAKIQVKNDKLYFKSEIQEYTQNLESYLTGKIESIGLMLQNLSLDSIEESLQIGEQQWVQDQQLNNDSIITVFQNVKCQKHNNYLIEKICLNKECKLEKNLCDLCAIDHNTHKDQIYSFEVLGNSETFTNGPIITEDTQNKVKSILNKQQQIFLTQLINTESNKLVLNYINQLKIYDTLQQSLKFNRLSDLVNIKKNKLELCLTKISDLYDFIQQDIEEYFSKVKRNLSASQDVSPDFQQLIEQSSLVLDQQSKMASIDFNQGSGSSFNQSNCSDKIKCLSKNIIKSIILNIKKIFILIVMMRPFQMSHQMNLLINLMISGLMYIQNQLKKSTGMIWIGIAEYILFQKKLFRIEQIFDNEIENNRLYLVAGNGFCCNSYNQQIHNRKKSIQLEENKEYRLTYDKTQKGFEFRISNIKEPKMSFSMPLPSFVNEQIMFVCILLENMESEVELLSEH